MINYTNSIIVNKHISYDYNQYIVPGYILETLSQRWKQQVIFTNTYYNN